MRFREAEGHRFVIVSEINVCNSSHTYTVIEMHNIEIIALSIFQDRNNRTEISLTQTFWKSPEI